MFGVRLAILLILTFLFTSTVTAQIRTDSEGHSILVSGFVATVTPDTRIELMLGGPSRDDLKLDRGSGYGGEAWLMASRYVALGLGLRYSTVGVDWDRLTSIDRPQIRGKFSVVVAEVWSRWFFPNGFEHWRPYVVGGLGIGRPKGTVEYEDPFIIPLPDGQGTIELQRLESTVSAAVLVTGGIGVLVPIGSTFGFNVEPRYTMISTKGSTRTDEYETADGEITEIEDTAKSNTNWWEVRVGINIRIN
jgi:hypothetical protein